MIYYVEIARAAADGGPRRSGADHTYYLPWLLPLARTHRLIFIDERGSASPTA